MAKDPRQVAEKWSRRLSGATEDIRQGIQAVTEAPSKKAIAKKEKLKARWLEAVDGGKWETALGKVTLEEWKEKVLNKGLARLPQGVEDARPKMEDFMGQLIPYVENVRRRIEGMPDRTLEDRINRMVTFVREMSKFRKK